MAVGERAILPEKYGGKEESDDMRVEESVEINGPLQEVFDYAANPREPAGVIEHSPRGAKRNAGAIVEEGARFTTVAKFP